MPIHQSAPQPDVIVVGGGVIGWACAYYLGKGGMRVLVLDAGRRRPAASFAAAGLVAPSPQLTKPSPFATLALESVQALPALRDELLAASGIDIKVDVCGTLRVATNEQQAASQQKRLPQQRKLGLELQWLSADEARRLEPALPDHVVGAIYGPCEAQLDARSLVRAYRLAAEGLGVEPKQELVRALVIQGTTVIGVRTARQDFLAKHVVLAAGAWTSQLGIEIPLTPERGQIIQAQVLALPPRHIIFMDQLYVAPKKGMNVIIGAAKDNSGLNCQTSLAGVRDLTARILEAMPQFAGASLQAVRAGLRPRTPDGVPCIGPLPGWEGVSLATGHGSNGLLFSAITGQIIAAQASGLQLSIPTDPFQPERFSKCLSGIQHGAHIS
jgi:glycine oxidase